jgi:hypothetical protein
MRGGDYLASVPRTASPSRAFDEHGCRGGAGSTVADAGDSPFLFPSTRTEGAIRGDAVTKALQRISKQLMIGGVGPHDIRRTIGHNTAKAWGVG